MVVPHKKFITRYWNCLSSSQYLARIPQNRESTSIVMATQMDLCHNGFMQVICKDLPGRFTLASLLT